MPVLAAAARATLRRPSRENAARAVAAVGLAAALLVPGAPPALGQSGSTEPAGPTVLAGPRLDHDCEAPVALSLFYSSKRDQGAIHDAVARGGGDCVVHAASRLPADAPADGPGPWHWAELPEDRERYIVLGFHDVEDGTIGWVQLHNRSDAWYVRTNAEADWQRLMNRERRVFDWDGVAVALYNPPSEGDWSPLDIWYRFVVRSPDGPADPPLPMVEAEPGAAPRS